MAIQNFNFTDFTRARSATPGKDFYQNKSLNTIVSGDSFGAQSSLTHQVAHGTSVVGVLLWRTCSHASCLYPSLEAC